MGARRAEKKKGADKGVDGRLYFHIDPKDKEAKQIIFSVKAGKLSAVHLRELRGVVEREKAAIGVLICMEQPTKGLSLNKPIIYSYSVLMLAHGNRINKKAIFIYCPSP